MPYKNLNKRKEYQEKWKANRINYWKEWYDINIDKQKIWRKEWRKKHPDYWINTGRDFWREKIRKRDDYSCQICGKKWDNISRRFDVHKKGLDDSGEYKQGKNFNDWITLCHKCHLQLHFKLEK